MSVLTAACGEFSHTLCVGCHYHLLQTEKLRLCQLKPWPGRGWLEYGLRLASLKLSSLKTENRTRLFPQVCPQQQRILQSQRPSKNNALKPMGPQQ